MLGHGVTLASLSKMDSPLRNNGGDFLGVLPNSVPRHVRARMQKTLTYNFLSQTDDREHAFRIASVARRAKLAIRNVWNAEHAGCRSIITHGKMRILPGESPPDPPASPFFCVGELLRIDLKANGKSHPESHAEENVRDAWVHVIGQNISDDERGFDSFQTWMSQEVRHAKSLIRAAD